MPLNTTRLRRGICSAFAVALLAFGCRKPIGTERAGATASVAASSMPAPAAIALVPAPRHDFGAVSQRDTLRHAFVTRNETHGVLAVENTLEVLGCSGVPEPRVLEPGQRGRLDVTCRAHVFGPLHVSLPLRANGRSAGELLLLARVEPLLAFEPSFVDVNVPFGEDAIVEARLRGSLARNARLELATLPPPGMNVRVLRVTDGGVEGAVLRVSGAPTGMHVGSLRFSTNVAEPKEIELSYSVKVSGTLAVSPTNPVLDLGTPQGGRSVVTVTSKQPGFSVERADVLEGPFVAHVRRRGAGAFEVELSVVEAKVPLRARGVNGRVRIVSNDRTEPIKELPLFALGRAQRASDHAAP